MERIGKIVAIALPVGQNRVFEVGFREIAVFNIEGEFHAISNICPHVGVGLNDGQLKDTIIACPAHGWQFDVTTGHRIAGDKKVESYPTSIEAGMLKIELPDE